MQRVKHYQQILNVCLFYLCASYLVTKLSKLKDQLREIQCKEHT